MIKYCEYCNFTTRLNFHMSNHYKTKKHISKINNYSKY